MIFFTQKPQSLRSCTEENSAKLFFFSVNSMLLFYMCILLIPVVLFAQNDFPSTKGTIKIKKRNLFIITELVSYQTMDGVMVRANKGSAKLELQPVINIKAQEVINLNEYFKANMEFTYPDTAKTFRIDTVIIVFAISGNTLHEVGSSVCRTADKFLGPKHSNDLGLACYKVMNSLQYWKVKDSNAIVSATCRLKVYVSNYKWKD